MNKKKFIISTVLLALILTACGGGGVEPTEVKPTEMEPTPYPEVVDWETAVEIIHRGEVETVFQSHSLDVTLYLKDGQSVITVEPNIDEVIREIDACGAPCSQVMIATE